MPVWGFTSSPWVAGRTVLVFAAVGDHRAGRDRPDRGDPEEHREVARFQAIEGKTWNHPVVTDGNLLVRNAEEAACFELPAGNQAAAASRTPPTF